MIFLSPDHVVSVPSPVKYCSALKNLTLLMCQNLADVRIFGCVEKKNNKSLFHIGLLTVFPAQLNEWTVHIVGVNRQHFFIPSRGLIITQLS